jgi:hypothetical protein
MSNPRREECVKIFTLNEIRFEYKFINKDTINFTNRFGRVELD